MILQYIHFISSGCVVKYLLKIYFFILTYLVIEVNPKHCLLFKFQLDFGLNANQFSLFSLGKLKTAEDILTAVYFLCATVLSKNPLISLSIKMFVKPQIMSHFLLLLPSATSQSRCH